MPSEQLKILYFLS